MAVAIDSSVLVRSIVNDHKQLSPKADQILDQAKPRTLLLDRLIIEEIGYVLRTNYEFDKQNISNIYQSLLANEAFLIPARDDVQKTVDLFESEKPLSFEDCWLLALRQNGKVTGVVTFDAGLAKRL